MSWVSNLIVIALGAMRSKWIWVSIHVITLSLAVVVYENHDFMRNPTLIRVESVSSNVTEVMKDYPDIPEVRTKPKQR